MSNNDSDNESYSIVYIYELFYNLFKSNDKIIVSNFIDNRIITTLIGQLESENKEIRNIIYDSVIYLIKQTNDYKKEYFELNEGEEEGKYNFEDKNTLKHSIDRSIVNILFEEKPELLNMLLTILEYDDENFGNEFIKETYRLFSEYEDKNKTEDLLNILFTQIKINDSYTFGRLYKMMGYPSLVIKSIPREIKYKSTHNIYNNYDSDNDDAISDSDEDKEKKSPKKIQQKWPLFGEKLINGDINKQVYEYLCPNHKEKNICLLNLLFPSEYCEQKEKIKNKERENNDIDNIYSINNIENDDNDDEDEEKNIKKNNNLVISEENKRKILRDIVNTCFGELNNYALFKYIYLMPARTLLYKNLYEEIKIYLKEDKNIDLDKIKEKEEKYILNIEKEINTIIEKYKKKDKEKEEDKCNYYHNIDDDDDYEEFSSAPIQTIFKCLDKNLTNFIGFNKRRNYRNS